MVKILSQSGDSLADIYDVEGSIAGIEHLETHDLPIVHELGATVFAERFSAFVFVQNSGNVAQNTAINLVASGGLDGINRVLGVSVITDDASRLANMALMVRAEEADDREFPIWVWDGANNLPIRMDDQSSGVTAFEILTGSAPHTMLPSFVGGDVRSPQFARSFALRGITTGFGAGTVFVHGIYYLARARQAGLSSRGLPMPSW